MHNIEHFSNEAYRIMKYMCNIVLYIYIYIYILIYMYIDIYIICKIVKKIKKKIICFERFHWI